MNAFSVDGRFTPLTVTDRIVAEPPAFGVALAHVWPSSLAPEQVGAAVDAAREAAAALGVRDGPTYTQVVVGERGAHVVELAARLGGGHDAELCEAALGVDLNGLALAAALGEPVDAEALRPVEQAGGACVALPRPAPGVLESVTGVDEAEAHGRGRVGARLPRSRAPCSARSAAAPTASGAVLAVGDTRDEAVERARRAPDCVRFVTADATEAVV